MKVFRCYLQSAAASVSLKSHPFGSSISLLGISSNNILGGKLSAAIILVVLAGTNAAALLMLFKTLVVILFHAFKAELWILISSSTEQMAISRSLDPP